jgi:transglycosylase-like protein with SLT domain
MKPVKCLRVVAFAVPLLLGPTIVAADEAHFVERNGVLYVFNIAPGVGLGDWAGRSNPSYASLIAEMAERHNVPAALITAVIRAESNFNPRAVSRKGAQGLMQLMPATAAQLGVQDAFDPRENIDGGVRFLRDLLYQYRGDVRLAVAAYNAGPEVVDRLRDVPPYRETQSYVARVLRLYDDRLLLAADRVMSLQSRRAVPPRPTTIAAARATGQRAARYVAPDGTLVYTNLPYESLPLATRDRLARATPSAPLVALGPGQ